VKLEKKDRDVAAVKELMGGWMIFVMSLLRPVRLSWTIGSDFRVGSAWLRPSGFET
jgi:hypothetical protein